MDGKKKYIVNLLIRIACDKPTVFGNTSFDNRECCFHKATLTWETHSEFRFTGKIDNQIQVTEISVYTNFGKEHKDIFARNQSQQSQLRMFKATILCTYLGKTSF